MSPTYTLPSYLSYFFKVFCFVISLLITNVFISSAQTGVLDVGFGNRGKVVTSIGDSNAVIGSVVIQTDGKIVAAGYTAQGGKNVVALVRYNIDGTPDNSFGTGGKVTASVGTINDIGNAVAIQSDGKIIVAVTTQTSTDFFNTNNNFALTRYSSNGILDSTFGTNGIATTDFFGGDDDPSSMKIKPDGKILVAGSVSVPGFDFGLAQYNPNGILDSSFGTQGKMHTNLPYRDDGAYTVALQQDGKIILAGNTNDYASHTAFALVRYNSFGIIDSTFGSNGTVITVFQNGYDYGYSLSIQPNGKILLVGEVTNAPKQNIALVRYNTNGTLDNTFGLGGKVITGYENSDIRGVAGLLQPDGKILVAGAVNTYSPNSNFALVRYNNNGSLDSSFGKQGIISTDFRGFEDMAYSAVLQPDGKVILAGYAASNALPTYAPRTDFALARYEANAFLYYNTLKGSIFFDNNSNGIKDSNEPFYTNANVVSTKAGIDTILLTTSNGKFSTDIDTGLYVTKIVPYSSYYTAVPASRNTSFTTYFNTDSISFAVQPVSGKRDLSISLVPLAPARPGFTSTYKIFYVNKGTDTVATGTVELIKSNKINFVSASPAPTFISGDTLRWTISNLKPQDTAGIIVNIKVQPPPAVNIGDTLRSTAIISSLLTDLTPLDNKSVLIQKVIGSFDPNDKTENHAGSLNTQQVSTGDYLTYTIRFQNTGTDTAFNVYVKDTLNNKLDWSTLQMITASHNYQLTVNDENKLSWSFNNINLVDSNRNELLSHGYIVYRIKPKSSIVPGDTIKNTAGIYFDYNLPVSTNVERTAVESSVLPLKLTAFSASREGKNNLIQWSTSQQINTDRFEVERSVDGRDYIMVGTVNVLTGSYSFIDKKPAKGINYYRLKTIDKDGRFEYSIVRTVNNSESVEISIYPNPVRDIITLKIESDKQSAGRIEIVSLDGKVLQSNSFNVPAGSTIKLVYVKHLAGGTYFLRLTTGEQQQATKFEKL